MSNPYKDFNPDRETPNLPYYYKMSEGEIKYAAAIAEDDLRIILERGEYKLPEENKFNIVYWQIMADKLGREKWVDKEPDRLARKIFDLLDKKAKELAKTTDEREQKEIEERYEPDLVKKTEEFESLFNSRK